MTDRVLTRWIDLGARTLDALQVVDGRASAKSRYRLSEWSVDGGFAHGADVVPALWHLTNAVLGPGEQLDRVEQLRFRKMIFEQFALSVGDDPPADPDVLVTWSTSRGRRVSVWGTFDGRPLEQDVIFARNPLVFSRVPEPLAARTSGSTIEWNVEALAPEHHARSVEEGAAGRLSAFLDLVGFLSRMMKSVGRVKPDAYFLIAGMHRWVTPELDALSAAATLRAELRWSGKRKTRTDTWLLPIDVSWIPDGTTTSMGGGTIFAAYDDIAFTFAEPWLTEASTR